MYAERAAVSAATDPWVLRAPMSMTGLPWAAWAMRAALVAKSVPVVIVFSNAVSANCAWIIGAVTSKTGSESKTMSPSLTA